MSDIKDFVIENGVLKNYTGNSGAVVIPAGVTSIGERAFEWCRSLTNLVIPKGVTSIGDSAFDDCSCLTNLVIPAGVTSIGSWAFYKCRSLPNVVIPEGMTSSGECVFYCCSSLTNAYVRRMAEPRSVAEGVRGASGDLEAGPAGGVAG